MIILKSIFCSMIIIIPVLSVFITINIIIHYYSHKSSRENFKWKMCKIDDVLTFENLTDITHSTTYCGDDYYTLEFTNNIKMNCYISGIYVLENKSSYVNHSVILSFKDYIKYYFIYKIFFRKAHKILNISKNKIKEN